MFQWTLWLDCVVDFQEHFWNWISWKLSWLTRGIDYVAMCGYIWGSSRLNTETLLHSRIIWNPSQIPRSRKFSSYLKIDKNRDLLWHIFHLIYHLHSNFYKLYRPTEMKSEIKLICRIKKKKKNITNDCQCDSRLRRDDAERLQRFNVNLLWAKCSLRKLELLLGDDLLGQEECELPLWLICLVQVD